MLPLYRVVAVVADVGADVDAGVGAADVVVPVVGVFA
jgi:hypothetical protein